jgi:hypothetical protein
MISLKEEEWENQAQRDSNPRRVALETTALPLSYGPIRSLYRKISINCKKKEKEERRNEVVKQTEINETIELTEKNEVIHRRERSETYLVWILV